MKAEERVMITHQIKRVDNILHEMERIRYSELKNELLKLKQGLIDVI